MACDPDALQAAAKCLTTCIPPGGYLPVLISLMCQIRDNGGGGGGGSGTVTSFSAGNLSPLFTTSVATPTTTPALSFAQVNQAANLMFAGPGSGAAAAPTFRAMVNADLGTTLTPQFARIGIGLAADATVPFVAQRGGGGDIEVFRITASGGGNPFLNLASGAGGGLVLYNAGFNQLVVGVQATATHITIDGAGSLSVDGGLLVAGGNIDCQVGIFRCQAQNGISQTFDTGIGNTQIQFIGGIAVSIS